MITASRLSGDALKRHQDLMLRMITYQNREGMEMQGEFTDILHVTLAGKRLWHSRHTGNKNGDLKDELAEGLYLFMMKELPQAEPSENLIHTLQNGLDEGFEYYMKDLDTAVATASFARLRNLYNFRNTPEEKVIQSGDTANLLEAAVWCLVTTTTLPQVLMKAAGFECGHSERIVSLAGGLAGVYYGAADLPAEWRDEGLEKEL